MRISSKFRMSLITFAVSAAISPAVSAIGVKDTYHHDFRNSVKIDLQPQFALKQGLSGEALARSFLQSNQQKYGLNSNFDDLKLEKTKQSLLGTHYYFRQSINGIPVDKGEIIVSVSKQNTVMKVFNNTFPVSAQKNLLNKASIDNKAAEEIVWNFLQVSGKLQATPKSELTYINLGKNFKLAYKVNMTVTQPFGDWEFYLDAINGDVIKATRIDLPISKNANAGSDNGKWKAFPINKNGKTFTDALQALENNQKKNTQKVGAVQADATGVVFDPDPVTTLTNDTLEDTSPASSFDGAYFTKTLRDVTLNGGTYSLEGPWVTIADFESPNTAPSTTTDGAWIAKRGDNSFNDAMTYYHIDQNQRYIQSLGFTGATGIQFGSISVDTDGVNGDDNSHYIPGTNQLAFGHGCVDDNEDIDVILHEYDHGLNHSINPSFSGGDTGAMGEGFSDYWAASYSYSTPNGRSFHPERAFSWDGHNACWNGRLLNQTSLRYDPTQTYDAHAVVAGVLGDELWSTPLAESLNQLLDAGIAREEVDQIILESQFGLGAGLTMPDMAAAIVSAAVQLFPAGQHAQVFNTNFKTMNILGDPLTFDSATIVSAGGNDIADPGEAVTLNVALKNSGGTSLTGVSGSLSSSTANVSIDVANSDYNDIAALQTETNSLPFQFTIPANQACGSDIQLTLASNYNDGSPQTGNFDFTVPVGKGNDVSQASAPGTSIPDNDATGITDQLTLAGAVAGSTISVDMNITHTYRGDLTLTLTSPAGTSVTLQSPSNDGTDDIIGNYPNDITPANSLSAFDNEDHNGQWMLKVVDSGAQDLGTLNSWAIISTSPAVCNVNAAPVAAVVNSSINVIEGGSVNLDATPTSDPEGDPITFSWTQISGESATINNADAAQASFTAPSVLASSELIFEVTATDDKGASNTATVTVTVDDANGNHFPVASVENTTLTVTEGDNVSLNATSSSDPDGDALTFLWVQKSGTAVTLNAADSADANFTASTAGDYEFEVTVTDTSGAIDTKSVAVTVNPPNEPPTAVAMVSSASVTEGSSVTLDASGSTDPNGDTLTYEWSQTSGPTVTMGSSSGESNSFTAPQVSADTTLEFSLTVTDPSGATDSTTVSLTVTDVPPATTGGNSSSGGGGSQSLLSLLLLSLVRLRNRQNK